jgi:hypothetical protein
LGSRFLVLRLSLLTILAAAGIYRSVVSQVPQKSLEGAPKGIITCEYAWRDFARLQRKCRFEIPRADLAASEAEFGADPEDMKPFEIRLERQITYTSEQARDPQLMARLKKQAQAEADRQAKAALETRRNKLISRGFVLIDEKNVTVDLGKLWRWNLKRMLPHAKRLAASVDPKDPPAKAVLAFVQEIPYRKPPDERAGRCTFGFLPPLEALAAGYGDCDTKSLLFASLADDGRGPEVILLRGPGHVVAGLECSGKEKGTKFRAFGKTFLICECSDGVWLPGEVSPKIQRDIESGLYKPIRLRKSE